MKYLVIFLFLIITVRSVVVTGGSPLKIQIDGKDTTLTIVEVEAVAEKDMLKIVESGNKEYTLGPTWTAFNLNFATSYRKFEFEVNGYCTCKSAMRCDGICPGIANLTCFQHVKYEYGFFDNWNTLKKDADKISYCWFFRPSTFVQYDSMFISHRYTIGLTDYSGPIVPKKEGQVVEQVTPGYTIKDQRPGVDYTYNMFISEIIPRKKQDLSLYRYAQSEKKIVTIDDVLKMQKTDHYTIKDFNVTLDTCRDDTFSAVFNATFEGSKLTDSADRAEMTLFTILDAGKAPTITELTRREILGPKKLSEWSKNDPTFDFLDPCNEQFLTLRRDENGKYYVKMPPFQTLQGDTICIALNEEGTPKERLVLYEIKNFGTTWTPSTRFIGGLSDDYLDKIKLKITTKSSFTINVKELTIHAETVDADPPLIKLTTSAPANCMLYVSKTCSFPLQTTTLMKSFQVPVPNTCGNWYQTVSYNCDGVLGSFNPSTKYSNVPASKLYAPAHQPIKGSQDKPPTLPKTGTTFGEILSNLWDSLKNFTIDTLITILKYLAIGCVVAGGVLGAIALIIKLAENYCSSCFNSIKSRLFSKLAAQSQPQQENESENKKKNGDFEDEKDDDDEMKNLKEKETKNKERKSMKQKL